MPQQLPYPNMFGFIFQSLEGCPMVDLIERFSDSPFSHCGILSGQGTVLESLSNCGETPIEEFVARGRYRFYSVYTTGSAEKDRECYLQAQRFIGIPYNTNYQIEHEGMFCSKLLWEVLKKYDFEIPFSSFSDASNEKVKEDIIKNYGEIPSGYTVTPSDVVRCLKFVCGTYPPMPPTGFWATT